MKILMINVVCGIRSTGRICSDLATELEKQGHDVKIAYGREMVPKQFSKYAVKIGTELEIKKHGLRARICDGCGFGSKKGTQKFVEWVKEYDPDVIHLHNLHGYYINIEVLFDYLRLCNKRIIWTLHDCWAFTGHAAFCEASKCNRWSKGCYECPKKNDYPVSFLDNSKNNWEKKKNIFCGIENLSIITPSKWLADLVHHSFLKEYPVEVIPNGIDTGVFKHFSGDIYKRYGISGKKVILGLASVWDERKGLKDFYSLQHLLDNREYTIFLAGLSKKQKQNLPAGIYGITRTNNVSELVELYSAAHVFVNPTYEDNYPTTNLEAIACGTPVITYATGGSGESAAHFGTVVDVGDVKKIRDAVINIHLVRQTEDSVLWLDKKRMLEDYLSIMVR